jgi:hypothetical protein
VVALALALVAGGCGGPTTLVVALSLADGLPQPDSVRVSLFGAGPLRAPASLPIASAGKQLPGTVYVGDLDATTPSFRVLCDGLDAQGAVISQAASQASLSAGAQTQLSLTLTAPLADSDGDGVPDVIDDCPQLADPEQRCTAAQADALPADDLPFLFDLSSADAADAAPTPDLLNPDAGALPCPAGALFCDDFESGTITKWNGGTSMSAGLSPPSIVTTAPIFRGSRSLFARVPADITDAGTSSSEYSYLEYDFVASSPAAMAAREYVYIPSAPGGFSMPLGLFDNTNGYAVGADTQGNWVITQDQAANPDKHSLTAVPLGRWLCVELLVEYGTTTRVRLFVDGQTLIDFVPVISTIPKQLYVGVVRGPGTVTTQYQIDDVALATQRIGCE